MSWPLVEIKSVARVVGGATPKSDVAEYWGGNISWVTPKDLADLIGKDIHETPRTITESGLQSSSTEILPPNSVLFSSRAPIGHIAINSKPMATNQGFKSFIPSEKLDASFLYWWLDANREMLKSLGNGATFKEVSKAVVERIEIPLPPLPEQRRIAAILDQADALRRLRRQSLSRLSELGQAIFRQMFGDLVANDKEFYDGRIGELIAGFDTGKNLAAAASDVISINRVLKVSAVTSGTFDVNESKPLSDNYKPPASHFVHSGDLLFSRANTASLIGATAVVNHPVENIVMPDKLWRFQWHRTSEAMFVHHLFQSVPMRREISRRASGTSGSMKNIAKEKVLSIKLGIPGESSRREFERKVEASDRIHALSASRNADSLFASLQNRAFRGEL